MMTDNCCFYLQIRLIQNSQTGGQWYSDTSPLVFLGKRDPSVLKKLSYILQTYFVLLGFNLSNRVTDTLECSSILIY
jgi:hypothetical protein